jgi:2'-5' RNA ligase
LFYLKMQREASNDPRLSRIFLALVPDAETAARVHRLAGVLKRAHRFSGRLIAPDRLHVSLFFVGGLPHAMVDEICHALTELRMPPFDVAFDRSVSFRGREGCRPFVLIGDDGPSELKSCHRAVGAALHHAGLRCRTGANFTPHVTLLYDVRSAEEHPIAEPIYWVASELVLIKSMNGHTHLWKRSLAREILTPAPAP